MEPLKVLEVNAAGGEVHVRSQSPTARDEQRSYYEVRLFKQGTLRLERRTFDQASRRRATIPCQLTRRSWSGCPTTSLPACPDRIRPSRPVRGRHDEAAPSPRPTGSGAEMSGSSDEGRGDRLGPRRSGRRRASATHGRHGQHPQSTNPWVGLWLITPLGVAGFPNRRPDRTVFEFPASGAGAFAVVVGAGLSAGGALQPRTAPPGGRRSVGIGGVACIRLPRIELRSSFLHAGDQ